MFKLFSPKSQQRTSPPHHPPDILIISISWGLLSFNGITIDDVVTGELSEGSDSRSGSANYFCMLDGALIIPFAAVRATHFLSVC